MVVNHVETVLVENSDDRLAEVEKAKRTGQPLVSVAANKSEVVPHAVATQIAEEKSLDNTYVGSYGITHAAHLQDYHEAMEDPQFVLDTNEEKARAHEEYSNQLVRKQAKDELKVKQMIAEGYDPSLAVQQANLERAMEHEAKSNEFMRIRQEREKDDKPVLQMVDESVQVLRAENLEHAPTSERAKALSSVANVPHAMEQGATSAFITKDHIVSTALDFRDQAASHEELVKRDRPAIEIMKQAGSPETLRDSTALAQLRADNLTEEAAKVERTMEEVAAQSDEESIGKKQDEAEAAVGGQKQSDEMRDNPTVDAQEKTVSVSHKETAQKKAAQEEAVG